MELPSGISHSMSECVGKNLVETGEVLDLPRSNSRRGKAGDPLFMRSVSGFRRVDVLMQR